MPKKGKKSKKRKGSKKENSESPEKEIKIIKTLSNNEKVISKNKDDSLEGTLENIEENEQLEQLANFLRPTSSRKNTGPVLNQINTIRNLETDLPQIDDKKENDKNKNLSYVSVTGDYNTNSYQSSTSSEDYDVQRLSNVSIRPVNDQTSDNVNKFRNPDFDRIEQDDKNKKYEHEKYHSGNDFNERDNLTGERRLPGQKRSDKF